MKHLTPYQYEQCEDYLLAYGWVVDDKGRWLSPDNFYLNVSLSTAMRVTVNSEKLNSEQSRDVLALLMPVVFEDVVFGPHN